MAQKLLHESKSFSEAAGTLVQAFGISKRQAYRYLREAQQHQQPVSIPEHKIAFTVKLPQGLVDALHIRARERGQKLSELVTQALDAFLSFPGGRGG